MSSQSHLASLPVEVLIDHVLPSLPASGLLNLSSTNKQFAALGDDDIVWKRKLLEDFNFSGEGTARTSGWKFIYRGLAHPRAYVWGDSTKGRLGLNSPSTLSSTDPSVPYPTRVKVPGKRIVSLVPGGWSFHALDDRGDVHVWGTMDASLQSLKSDGFSEPSTVAKVPHRLILNEPIRSVSAGRAHAVMPTATGKILNFNSWGLPYTLALPVLHASGGAAIKQVEAGWAFGAALTHDGHVFVWWPASDPLKAAYEAEIEGFKERVKQGEEALRIDALHGSNDIPCHLFELDIQPTELGDLPVDLPDLPLPEGQIKKEAGTRIVKIAAADNVLFALTNGGHVLKHGHLTDQTDLIQGRWEYMPNFSEVEIVREHETFKKAEDDPHFVKPPQTMRITHISAHFQSFVAYSTGASSIVLMGSVESTPQSQPDVKPQLQHRNIISVVLGDYHRAALTSTGKLFTWGSYSLGALGLGNPAELDVGAPGGYADERIRTAVREGGRRLEPPPVDVPTEVKFGREGTFVIQAAAAGWHTGALVIDLDPNAAPDEGDLDEHVAMPGAYEPQYVSTPPAASTYETPPFNPHALPTHAPGQIPTLPMLRGRGRGLPFRIGLAGARGRGMPLPPPEGQGRGL